MVAVVETEVQAVSEQFALYGQAHLEQLVHSHQLTPEIYNEFIY
jgi:hypothetical protein